MNHEEKILRELTKAERSRKRKNVWYRLVSALACLTVFVTTYALILPALTLDVNEYAVCGKPDHTHTDSCYGTKLVLDCPLGAEPDASGSEGDPYQIAPDAGHVHTDACWKEVPDYENLICGLEEHKHDMNCFTSDPEDEYALCPVKYEHKHTDDCYGTEGVLLCGYQEHTHTDACYFLKDRTIESRPASDGAVAVISGMMPIHAKAEIEAVTLSQAELEAIFGAKRAASMTSFVAYDIRIMVNGAEWQPNDTVTVAVKQPDIHAEAGEGLAVAHVDGDTAEVSPLDIKVDAEGDVSFDTDGFSLYIFYTFTVDFHYGDVVFSMEGYDAITLSDLFRELEIPLDAAGAVKVTFSDERLLGVFRMKDDWLLTSLEPFSTDETLTVYFEEGTVFELYVTDKQTGGTGTETGSGTNGDPVYAKYVVPSDAISDSGYYDPDSAGSKVITANWYSDRATSDLETLFYGFTSDPRLMETDDGKVLTDKSVVYGKDDYGVFAADDYDDYEFGVTLSALGQEYYLSQEYQVPEPVDVMIILDTSGSMSRNCRRLEDTIAAANAAIKYLMDDNPDNRVGVAIYSYGSALLLPLGRYQGTGDGEYGTTFLKGDDLDKSNDNNPKKINTVSGLIKLDYRGVVSRECENGVVTLRDKDGNPIGKITEKVINPLQSKDVAYSIQTGGTYTQYGIGEAWKEFSKVTDTKLKVMVNPSEVEAGEEDPLYVTVTRQPVYILLSDGEPTISTTNVDDPLNFTGKYTGGYNDYGSGIVTGNDENSDNKYTGVHAYYTVQTAASLKEQAGKHYGTTAYFYTIGMGIKSTGGQLDYFERAVLNPTQENINALESEWASNEAAHTAIYNRSGGLFYRLIKGKYDGGSLTVGRPTSNDGKAKNVYSSLESSEHRPRGSINPATNNPLIGVDISGRFNYADGAFFGNNTNGEFDPKVLVDTFEEIVKSSRKVKSYGLILRKRSTTVLTDPIGEGMQLTSYPVLHYDGTKYLPTGMTVNGTAATLGAPSVEKGAKTVYTYAYGEYSAADGSGFTADLSAITVTVITDSDGYQTVTFNIPDNVMPAYAPNDTDTYYYERLPARLVYQVGLTSESISAVEALAAGGEPLEFFTNRYSENDGGTSADYSEKYPGTAYSVCYPDTVNPYYNTVTYTSTWHPPRMEANTDWTKEVTVTKRFAAAATPKNDTEYPDSHVTGTLTNSWNYQSAGLTDAEIAALNVQEDEQSGAFKIINVLGNNGKLTFAPNAMKIDVEKVWDPGSAPTDATVTVYLYKNEGSGWTAAADGTRKSSVTLSSGNSWKASFTGLAKLAGGQYAVSEAPMSGYTTTYQESGDPTSSFGENLTGVNKVGFRVTADGSKSVIITNTAGSALPSTGGSGEKPFVLAGLGLIGLGALGAAFLLRRKRKREN